MKTGLMPKKHKNKPTTSKLSQKKHTGFLYTFAIVFFLILVIGIIGANLLANDTAHLPPINTPFDRSFPESTRVYDAKGNVIYTIYDKENRIYTSFGHIPQNMKMAMLAAEDINFYHEGGVNPTAILRAGIHDIFYNTDETSLQGASTITQQLIKYTSLSQQRTLQRKIQEVVMALQIAKVYSKDKILETYLNTIPFGGNNYGVEAASRAYFDKDIWQLDLAQCAFLAGLVQAPGAYSPVFSSNPNAMKYATQRQDYVLDQMLIHKDTTGVNADEIAQAKAEKLVFKSDEQIFNYPDFSLYIRDWLYSKYGKSVVQNDGLRVYTTLDPNIQNIAQTSVTNGVATILKQGLNSHNGSLVAMDATNGDVLAMVGSIDYTNTNAQVDGAVNMATTPVSPGSSVKPFVYITGFEHGMNAGTIVNDVPTTFPGNYQPMDFDNKFEGNIPLATALLQSRNIPAVETAYKVGIKQAYDNMLKAGMSHIAKCPIYPWGLSGAIGACNVPLIQEVWAYSVLSQDGVQHPMRAVLRVTDKYGKTIYTAPTATSQVLPANYVKEMNSILKNYYTMAPIKAKGYTVAGKTGTGQFNKNNLFLGYSSHLAVGVWCGNTNQSFTTNETFGENTAAPIWNDFMQQVLPMFSESPNF